MFAPEGYRAAPGFLIGAAPPSGFHIPYVALGDERWGRREVTAFHQTSAALVEMAGWLAFVSCLPATLFEYVVKLHRCNDSAARLARLSHTVLFRYQVDVGAAYLASLNDFVAKVFYVQGECSQELLRACRAMRVPPIVIYDHPSTLERCRDEGLSCWNLDSFSIPHVKSAIAELFQAPSQRLRGLGFSEASIDAAGAWSQFPEAFRLGETDFEQYPCTGQRYLFPNEVLINRLRGRLVPPPPAGPPDRTEAVRLVTTSTELTFAQKLLDYIYENEANAQLEPDLADRLLAYKQTPDNEHYQRLLRCCSEHISEYGPARSYILCTPAINHAVMYNVLKHALPNRILKYLFKQRADDYLAKIDQEDLRSDEDVQIMSALFSIQAGENAFLTSVLTLHALAARMPAIRTPQLASTLFTELRLLVKHEARNNTKAFAKELDRTVMALSEALPASVYEFIQRTKAPFIKLVGDIPFEWLPIDGVPLMFRTTLSRIPMTPGNTLFGHLQTAGRELYFGEAELAQILIINCMERTDPLYGHAQVLIDELRHGELAPQYEAATTVAEYREYLNRHTPSILVHWGHGSYDRAADRGYLHIGAERTEVWELAELAIPPIVLLAACETAALAPTHNTPANGWLALGARAVLGTYFPVDPSLTVTLLVRILANLAEAVFGRDELFTWAEVVSKTLILHRFLDFLYNFDVWRAKRELGPVPANVILEYTYRWNRARLAPADGYKQCTRLLRESMAHFGEQYGVEFDQFLERSIIFPHTMFFTHLGSPETIRIVRGPLVDPEDSPSLRYWGIRTNEDEPR